jgi:Bacteriophage holin family
MRDFTDDVQGLILIIIKLLFSSLVAYVVGFKMLFLALGWAIFFDLITGILAFCKTKKIKFSISQGEYVLRSHLLRLSFEKMGIYLLVILLMAIFETHIFKIQFAYIDELVGQPFYGTAIVTTICILIEYWSVLENLKKMGFDLIKKVFEIATAFYKIKDKLMK